MLCLRLSGKRRGKRVETLETPRVDGDAAGTAGAGPACGLVAVGAFAVLGGTIGSARRGM